jgi:hypothetical protein
MKDCNLYTKYIQYLSVLGLKRNCARMLCFIGVVLFVILSTLGITPVETKSELTVGTTKVHLYSESHYFVHVYCISRNENDASCVYVLILGDGMDLNDLFDSLKIVMLKLANIKQNETVIGTAFAPRANRKTVYIRARKHNNFIRNHSLSVHCPRSSGMQLKCAPTQPPPTLPKRPTIS